MQQQAADMAEQREMATAAKMDSIRRAMLESGPMLDHGTNDSSCPACGASAGSIVTAAEQATGWRPEKVHCSGRDPHASKGTIGICVILGDHLHARCPACSFSWFERVGYDTLRAPGRGAIRYDEYVTESGTPALKAQAPTMLSEWGHEPPKVEP